MLLRYGLYIILKYRQLSHARGLYGFSYLLFRIDEMQSTEASNCGQMDEFATLSSWRREGMMILKVMQAICASVDGDCATAEN